MIKKSFSLIFILFCLNAFSQEIIEKNLGSDILRAFRELKIYLPEGYVINNTKNYPLAIVFDSEQLFDAYVGNSVLFAAKDKAPKQIVVGISMKETKKNDTYFDLDTGKLTQSNSNFYEFVRDEVIFYMESTFRTSPFISLIGEGTSANLISHFLKEEKPFINSYVCINPTFSNFVNQEFDSYNLKKFSKEDNTFYLYINNSTSFSTQKQTKIEELQNSLKPLDFKNFNIINDNIVTTSSTSAIGEAIPRSLNQIFQIYSSISKEEFDKNIKDLSPLDAIEYLENKYLEIEFLFGSNLEIRDRDIYAIEKIVIEKENGDKLFELGKMILKRFPSSQLGDYYIGRYYESKKDFKKALRHYKIGYGKMDPSDPNSDKFYENVLRLGSQ
ncbi:alpha/beta hydrolase-fold protein [Polaribacter sp. Asnod1-A03]|uniref:alpha/beta hydrolase-fold protein n=1 Tax=Polaribacter sp. Asnod1-A03 TaxID=3160581 RepID=UPI00386BE967